MATAGRIRSIGCALGAAAILAGCGSTSLLPGRAGHTRSATSRSGSVPGDGNRPAAPAAAVQVIKGWSTALRTGHLAAAANYFALPSVFDDGSASAIEIRTLQDAETVNASLPCGAQYISAFRDDGLVDALFRLTTRTGPGNGNCNGEAGAPSRVAFLIRNGKIVHWLRAPDLPGDAQAAQRSGTAPSTTTTGTGTATGPGTVPTVPSTGTSTNPAI